MSDTERQFIVVMRGPSAALFRQGENIVALNFASATGPVNIRYMSRYIKIEDDVTIPGHLWIHIEGSATSLEDALVSFANAGLSMLPLLSLSTNAAIGEPDVEVGFDSTTGLEERDYFQGYVPGEGQIVHISRLVNVQATVALIEAVSAHLDGERLRRAANQYRLALDSWRLGRESLSLAHLWMALEALTKAKIRAECAVRGLTEERELAESLGVALKNLDATVRRDLLLKGDEECYRKAKQASDGFEHGFLGFDKIRDLSKDVRHRMAAYVRNAILEMSEVGEDTLQVLVGDPFDKPMGYWPVVKYLRGKLIGPGEDLAAEGNMYPFMRWQPTIKAAKVNEKGKMDIQIEETFTVETAEGIGFRLQSYEMWQAE